MEGNRRPLWADLHSHNALGYGKGSVERALELARSHLDVAAITPHAAWHDMPRMEGSRHEKWVRGFEVVRADWERFKRLVAEAYRPGEFVAILGYEWHSSRFGDYCLIYPGDEGDLFLPGNLAELKAHAAPPPGGDPHPLHRSLPGGIGGSPSAGSGACRPGPLRHPRPPRSRRGPARRSRLLLRPGPGIERAGGLVQPHLGGTLTPRRAGEGAWWGAPLQDRLPGENPSGGCSGGSSPGAGGGIRSR